MNRYIRKGSSIGILGYIVGTLVTLFAVLVTTVVGLVFIILPISGFLWALGNHIWNWELPRVAPIEVIAMTIFLGLPILALFGIISSELWLSHKVKIRRSYI